MPFYDVKMKVTRTYYMHVFADDEQLADEKAIDVWERGSPNKDEIFTDEELDVLEVQRIPKPVRD